MAFQRSYSKVWWGSDNQQMPSQLTVGGSAHSLPNNGTSFTSGGFYYGSYFSQKTQQQLNAQRLQYNYHNSGGGGGGNGYHSLDSGSSFRSHVGNLSRIQEVDDEHNSSKLSTSSWGKRDSPGSLRSQDSGFSDNDESHSSRSLGGRSSKPTSPSTKSTCSAHSAAGSPSSERSVTVATPPTVIRRVGKSEFYSPLVSVSRRISFSGSPAAVTTAATKLNVTAMTNDDDALTMAEAVSAAKKLNFDDANANAGGKAVAMPQQASAQTQLKQQENTQPEQQQQQKQQPQQQKQQQQNQQQQHQQQKQQPQPQQQPKRRRRIVRQATKPLSPTKRRTLLEETDNSDADEEQSTAALNVTYMKDGGKSFDELDRSAEINRSRTRLHIVPAYNNETVYLGVTMAGTPSDNKSYNNETMILGAGGEITSAPPHAQDDNNNTLKSDADDTCISPLKEHEQHERYTASTSTPKASATNASAHTRSWAQISLTFANNREYESPLLNGRASDLQQWLNDLRSSYEHEVMSTLQTKSIAQEAFKNLTITTNTVAKLIRQLQQRALYMQSDFERIERILTGACDITLHEALAGATQLIANVAEFTQVLERRAVFFNDSRADRKRFEENIEQIRIITKDTRYSIERQHYINLESLLDDVQVLKRNLLISVRQVFEKMVRIIVQSVEQGQCDLMLRANINMIATLMNIDYDGFASLTDAFVQNEAVRALLIVCLENKLSSVRALALRALATICCSPAAIAQLSACDGIEIVRDIVQVPDRSDAKGGALKHGDIERREAVSLLTQITAAWHGAEHRVDGLRDCAEIIVEGLTQLITSTSCAQTLLLCAAALNNLSRIEVTSHYSIMSNETIFKLIEVVEARGEEANIFLYEQIAAMLHNMSVNKKCHSHLANGSIINFITSAYQTEFYKFYNSRAQSDAQRRTIKAILHTLTHLVHESSLGIELLEQYRMPSFFRPAMFVGVGGGGEGTGAGVWGGSSRAAVEPFTPLDGSHGSDSISALAQQLLQEQQQQQQQEQQKQEQQEICRKAGAATSEQTFGSRAAGGDEEATQFKSNVNINAASLHDGVDDVPRRHGMKGGGAVVSVGAASGGGNFKFNLTRQESFV